MLPNGPIIFVGQHPDDAHASAGGLAATASELGVDVYTVSFTRGEAGWNPNQTGRQIAAIQSGELRTMEQHRADAVLGIRHTFFMNGYQDGQLSSIDPRQGVDALAPILQAIKPATVITWDHTGFFLHPDHSWGSDVTTQAIREAGIGEAQLWYVAFTPRAKRVIPARTFIGGRHPEPFRGELALSYPLPAEIWSRKRRALAQHRSQASLSSLQTWTAHEEFYAAII